jgi:hypothetical protein
VVHPHAVELLAGTLLHLVDARHPHAPSGS